MIQTIIDWASDQATSNLVRTLVALLAIPGALWGMYLFIKKLRGHGMDAEIGKIHALAEQIVSQQTKATVALAATAEAQTHAQERIEVALSQLVRRPDHKSQDAFKLLQAGDTTEAKQVFREILETKSQGATANNKEAAQAARSLAALIELQDPREAAKLYERAAKLDPEDIQNWMDMGDMSVAAAALAEIRRGRDIEEARKAYQTAQDLAELRQDQEALTMARARLRRVVDQKQVGTSINTPFPGAGRQLIFGSSCGEGRAGPF